MIEVNSRSYVIIVEIKSLCPYFDCIMDRSSQIFVYVFSDVVITRYNGIDAMFCVGAPTALFIMTHASQSSGHNLKRNASFECSATKYAKMVFLDIILSLRHFHNEIETWVGTDNWVLSVSLVILSDSKKMRFEYISNWNIGKIVRNLAVAKFGTNGIIMMDVRIQLLPPEISTDMGAG